jgi:X-X-X-Leu-X-X-Gly heptad repeat protein
VADYPYGSDPLPALFQKLLQGFGSRGIGVGGSLRNALPLAGPLGRGLSSGINQLRNGSPDVSSGIGGALGSSFGRLGSSLSSLGQNQPQQQDPMLELYNKLVEQLSSPVQRPTGVDTEDLMSQIQKALNPLYDARAQKAQGQSDRARGEVKDMYRALSNDYERLAPVAKEQAAQAQEEIQGLYGQLRSNIQGDYSRVAKEQADLFKQLGIEEAAPEVLGEQQDMTNQALKSAQENQMQQEQRYMDMGNIDQTYYQEGSPLATMAGNEISTDLLAQLQDFLTQNESERVSGIQSSYLDQLGQANSLLAQQQQQADSEMGRRQEMLWSMLQGTMQGKQQALTPDSIMQSLDPNSQQALAKAFTSLQRSPEAVYGKARDPRNASAPFVETTPEWYLSQADEMLRRGEISPTTHQQLLMYIQAYYGMGQ